jgi:hypothetical protein
VTVGLAAVGAAVGVEVSVVVTAVGVVDVVDAVDLVTVVEEAEEDSGIGIVVEDAEGMCDREVSLHSKARKRRSDDASSFTLTLLLVAMTYFLALSYV